MKRQDLILLLLLLGLAFWHQPAGAQSAKEENKTGAVLKARPG